MNNIHKHRDALSRVKPLAIALLLAASSHAALAAAERAPVNARAKPPIVLQSTGAYEVGGRIITNPADPRQTLSCDHGYVEYFIPAKPRKVGLIMWHSSSTKVWENRWDGGEGYKSMFLRQRYPVYLWDGPRVGRANWSCEPINYKPEFFDQRNFIAWRFGSAYPNWNAGLQFPVNDPEAWNQATRARYDEFDTLDNALLQGEAGGQAIDKIGPVVAVTNSAGGWRAMLSALKATGSNMKGIVAYETPGFVFPEGEGPAPDPKGPFGPHSVPLAEFMKLTRFPMQMVFGDNTATHPFWAGSLNTARTFCSIVNRHGGDCEVLVLPDTGLRGNSHIPFADLNNEAVGRELSKWLRRKGLDR
ncbi:MAG: alpha/beta fold hydrolase [Polaromonas sp.]|uniref:alpha/beta hydrolase n=1 Tax=Polaromonas sp. TaxID=1869339 RepID=UPI0025D0E6B9|nr:alpha/beta fold hydrolase [Polaromonas sp.]MBI2728701.1 alpha/beta fold hydrolase [Polaromonas sp.]